MAAAGSGGASAAIGTPISIVAPKPKVSGRRGLRRTEAMLPRITPIAPHVDTIPQSRAPPRCSRMTTGPSTMNAAKQKFVMANPAIGARTQARAVTSCRPSRSCWRNRDRGARRCVGSRSCSRKKALNAKLTASIANTQPVCVSAISVPENGGPEHVHRALRDAEQRVCLLQVCRAHRLRHDAVRRRPEERGRTAEERGRDEEDGQRHVARQ